jgi:hypothetical protein
MGGEESDVIAASGELLEGEEDTGDEVPGEVPEGALRASLKCPKEMLLVLPNTYSFIKSM